jgi:hypothetical protein
MTGKSVRVRLAGCSSRLARSLGTWRVRCEPVIGAGRRAARTGSLHGGADQVCRRHDVLLVIDAVICASARSARGSATSAGACSRIW